MHTHTSRAWLRVLRRERAQGRERERKRVKERGLLKYAVACAQMKEAKNEVANDRQKEREREKELLLQAPQECPSVRPGRRAVNNAFDIKDTKRVSS